MIQEIRAKWQTEIRTDEPYDLLHRR